ncbi:MBL fold metallo-hydrolase [uncultured Desulfuromonas sp.]|uniref:MBL fold metallo-hydrolase n=1 Tax=uncultured Desulfuromonas sp. TaxID=181013 RepID=UPI002AAA6A79|nr:MBL fold metallo-hydrolase [uncultured Desulfuromonas sp.]
MDAAYRFYVGEFVCYTLCDGEHTYGQPADLLFPQAPASQLKRELYAQGITDARSWESWTSTYSCLLVQADDHNVLIDSGAGDFLPTAGRLIANLHTIGIEPEQIDDVLLSHAHPDHIGAAQCFTRARIILNREEWRFWTGNPQLPRLPIEFREQLLTMIVPKLHSLQDRVELISPCQQILPGIEALDAAGHTPGHMAFSIKSQGEELLYIGDAILHLIHINQPRWSARVDVVPQQAVKTRQKLLQYAAAAPATIFGFHFPFPGIRQIPRNDGRLQQS